MDGATGTAVVVGAGPAGLASALLLARGGAGVTVVDREESFDRVFRGEGLMPLGLDALAQMGLTAALDAVPQRLVRSWDIWIDGEETFVIPEQAAQLGDRAVRVVSQPALLERLVEEGGRYPRFRFRPGVRVTDLLRDSGGRVTGVRAQTPDGPEELRADLVIGCDGRGSPVRTHAGLELERHRQDYDVLWCKLPAPDRLLDRSSFLIMVRAGAHPVLCYTSWDERLQLALILPRGGLRALGERDWVAEAVRSAPPWLADHVLAHRDAIEGPVKLTVLVGRCRTWSAPGVLLLGDAAHPMSPVRAQGINLALRDAIVAANHLVPALSAGAAQRPAAVDAACRAVQAEREPEIVRAQALQHREAQGQGDARAGSWRYGLAKRGARLLGHRPWAQRAWLARQRDLWFGSTTVELRLPAEPPR